MLRSRQKLVRQLKLPETYQKSFSTNSKERKSFKQIDRSKNKKIKHWNDQNELFSNHRLPRIKWKKSANDERWREILSLTSTEYWYCGLLNFLRDDKSVLIEFPDVGDCSCAKEKKKTYRMLASMDDGEKLDENQTRRVDWLTDFYRLGKKACEWWGLRNYLRRITVTLETIFAKWSKRIVEELPHRMHRWAHEIMLETEYRYEKSSIGKKIPRWVCERIPYLVLETFKEMKNPI